MSWVLQNYFPSYNRTTMCQLSVLLQGSTKALIALYESILIAISPASSALYNGFAAAHIAQSTSEKIGLSISAFVQQLKPKNLTPNWSYSTPFEAAEKAVRMSIKWNLEFVRSIRPQDRPWFVRRSAANMQTDKRLSPGSR